MSHLIHTRVLPVAGMRLRGLGLIGALFTALFATLTAVSPVFAQIVPDLRGGEPSRVSSLPDPAPNAPPNATILQIDGGAVRGANLFHNFEQFSVPTGSTAFFNNDGAIRNIVSRVTGSGISNIDGLIRTNGAANLFLINPNGIVFGPNAALNVGGSFVATTATTVEFGNQGRLEAADPVVPLLTVNPSALLVNQLATQAVAPAAIRVDHATLQVPNGQSLLLVGGPVRLSGATVRAPGGRVHLAGLGSPSRVELRTIPGEANSPAPASLDLVRPVLQPAANIALDQGTVVDVRAGGGGDITLYGNRIDFTEGSLLRAGIAAGAGGPAARAGDVVVVARSAVNLLQGSFIANSTLGTGDSGNVTVITDTLTLRDGAQVNSSTFGGGNGGKVLVQAQGQVWLDGEDADFRSSGFYSRVNPGAVGNSGGIEVAAKSVLVTNGAVLTATTLGQGNAGSVKITAQGEVRFAGSGPDQFGSGAFSGVRPDAMGNSGGIQITAASLAIAAGVLDASTFGTGNAGQISLNIAGSVALQGDASGQLRDPGGIYSFVGEPAVGHGGGINLRAESLSLQNGAALVATTFGVGDAGKIEVRVAGPVLLDGQTPTLSSGIFSSVGGTGQGNGGAIDLAADSLRVTQGAAIAASTLAQGNAGNVAIAVTGTASFDGVGRDGFPSGVFSSVREAGVGNGGNIQLTAGALELTRGGQLRASSIGQGNAGDIQLTIADTVSIQGLDAATNTPSGLLSNTAGAGLGGKILVQTGNLRLGDRALISAQSLGAGAAGDIVLRVRDRLQAQDGQIVTSAAQSTGGAITINAGSLRLQGNSDITTSVFDGTGGGGDVAIFTRALIALDDSDILAFSRNGRGGNITVRTPVFFGQRYAPAPAGTDPSTLNGNGRVDINASGKLSSGVISLPDISQLQKTLGALPSDLVDVGALVASSCLAKRTTSAKGSFSVIGAGSPMLAEEFSAPFTTYDLVLTPPIAATDAADPQFSPVPQTPIPPPIAQADGFYRLPNGDLILGRSCH